MLREVPRIHNIKTLNEYLPKAKWQEGTPITPSPTAKLTLFDQFVVSKVAEAIFQRYPNPFARHVLSEDTVHRELLSGGTLYTRRLVSPYSTSVKATIKWN